MWTPPANWTTGAIRRETFAIAPRETAVLLRAAARPHLRSDADFTATVTNVLSHWVSEPVLGEVHGSGGRWSRTRHLEGTAQTPFGPVQIAADATRTAAVFVRISLDRASDERAAMQTAVDSWSMLVSHACECGTDCDSRPD